MKSCNTLMRRALTSIVAGVLLFGLALSGSAQDEGEDDGLRRILQGLDWGASHEGVLDYFHELYLDDYRAEIAGLRDPLEIDEIRRFHDQRLERLENSYEVFDGTRTGYEASVLDTEIASGNDESMMTLRNENATLYYCFAGDRLWKIAVSYNDTYLGGLEFESFLDQLERSYGNPISTEMEETSIGIRYMARARWEESDTRLRVENHSNVFGSFILVFTSSDIEDSVDSLRGSGGRSSNEVVVSDLIRGITENSGRTANQDVADMIIGHSTVVELTVPPSRLADLQREEAVAAGQQAADWISDAAQAEAEQTAELLADARARRARERREAEQAEEETEEGITVH